MHETEPVAEAGNGESECREGDARRDRGNQEAGAVETKPDQVAALQEQWLRRTSARERPRQNAEPEHRRQQREAGAARAELLLGEQQLADVEQAREQDDRRRPRDHRTQTGHLRDRAHARSCLAHQRA